MSEFFDDVLQAMEDVDRTFGEAFAYAPFAPTRDTTAPDAPDATRASATVRAVFVEREGKPPTHSWDARQERRPGIETGGPVLEISVGEQRRLAVAGTPLTIRVSDRFTRALTGSVFRVAAIEPVTPMGLMRLKVNEL